MSRISFAISLLKIYTSITGQVSFEQTLTVQTASSSYTAELGRRTRCEPRTPGPRQPKSPQRPGQARDRCDCRA